MYPRDNNFMVVDEKIYWVQDEIHPLLSHSAHTKNIIIKNWSEKPKILCGVLIWAYKLAKKISSHFDIRIHMLLFIQYIKEFFNIYNHHYRFQKTDIDENKPTVIPVITIGLFWKPAVIYKKLKKIVPAPGSRATEFRHLTAALV